MKNMPKISVIVPIYNAEKYLNQCIDSILNQTYENLEIICVNDGSTDNSLNILNQYQSKYKNIKVITKENSGVIDTRIIGLKNATGDYVGWTDSDDFLEPTMYEKMYNVAVEKKADYIICNYKFYPKSVKNKNKWFKEINGTVSGNLIMDNVVLWNELVKKSLIDEFNICELLKTMGEGAYSLLITKAKKVFTINEELYNYRVGHGSLSTNYKNINWFEKVVKFNKEKLDYAILNSYSEYWIKYFKFEYLYYVLVLMIVASYNSSKNIFLNCKKILLDNSFFDGEYDEYLMVKFTKIKLLFFRTIGIKSFFTLRIASKFYLK